ncbi:MAG: sigma factor G inhibitor Gin [Clostridia bacterium]|nr:sigma factor G inhibitor Gin [Clostridia bacterium]
MEESGKVLPVCLLCNLVPEEGLCSGFFLKGVFICSRCEDDLISCNADNSEKYTAAMEKLREVLFKKKS